MIEETIKSIAILIKQGVNLTFIKMVLIGDGFSPRRADTVILWAKQLNERELT